MMHRFVFETVDCILRNIYDQQNMPFGRKLVLFGADFKQLLPTVTEGSKVDIIVASLS